MKHLEYKGYFGTVEPDFDNNLLFGKLAYIRDTVTYEAETLADLTEEFHQSVDMYMESCAEMGKEPDRPFKGSFNVRAGEELHRAAVLAAEDQSLNAFVCDAIREKIERVYKAS